MASSEMGCGPMRGSQRGGNIGRETELERQAGALIGGSVRNLDSSMTPQVYHQRDLQRTPTLLRGHCREHVRDLLEVCEGI